VIIFLGSGARIILQYVVINTDVTTGSIATQYFISLRGDSFLDIIKLNVSGIRSSTPLIYVSGNATVVIDEANITQSNLTGASSGASGTFLYGFGQSGTARIWLLNSVFSYINGSGSNGVVANLDQITTNITMSGNQFLSITNTNNGGALYFVNIPNITLLNNSFTGLTATNNGGSVYFGGGTVFNIINTTFQSSQAVKGGAIYSISDIEADRIIINCTFISNSASSMILFILYLLFSFFVMFFLFIFPFIYIFVIFYFYFIFLTCFIL
jgi:hypothetical protein